MLYQNKTVFFIFKIYFCLTAITAIKITSTQKREQLTLQNIYHRKVHFAKPNFYLILSQTHGPIPQVII